MLKLYHLIAFPVAVSSSRLMLPLVSLKTVSSPNSYCLLWPKSTTDNNCEGIIQDQYPADIIFRAREGNAGGDDGALASDLDENEHPFLSHEHRNVK